MTRLLVAALGLALAACTGPTARLNSTSPDAVTVLYPEGDRDKAEKIAADECAKYNKRARARSTTDRSQEKLAIFDCVV
jgi:hypothetical protein